MMKRHRLTILRPAKETPSQVLPDGAITGNGDVTAMLAGGADRIHLYIGKSDFWKADGGASMEQWGGISPLGLVEILLPHLAYADYRAVQDLDEAYIGLELTLGKLTADLRITVCAESNTILLQLDLPHPAVSASASLIPLEGAEAIVQSGESHGVT